MKEEKMMILSMLEEGKITSEEAIKLMEALEEKEAFDIDEKGNSNFTEHKNGEKTIFKDKFNSLEDIGSDIGNALSNMFDGLKDINPSNVLDGLKDIGTSFGFKYNYDTTTTDLEMNLDDIENPSLDLRGINGDINVRPTDKNVLSINVTCQYKKGLLVANEPYFDFTNIDGKITFTPKYNSNISIKLDISLPEKTYNEIKLNTTNGKIYTSELNAKSARCTTSNSSIEFAGGNINLIDLTTKNGKIEIRDITSKTIKPYTTNSSIQLTNIKSESIDAKTVNGKIMLSNIKALDVLCKTSNSTIDVKSIDAPSLNLMTSNGKILLAQINTSSAKSINLTTSNSTIISEIHSVDKEVLFDLETSMGSINLDIPNLVYTTNKQVNLGLKKIVAHSVDYDVNKDHINFVASTSNGSIKIN